MKDLLVPSSRLVENGLRVVELPVPGRLATSLSVAFPAGARQERPGEVGGAHLLEHLAFKGSERFSSARELSRCAERLGTELNAHTADDFVEFFSIVRAESAVQALELLVDVAGAPLLEEGDLESERAVVLQELADEAENPSAVADELVCAAVFGDHRLGTTTAGEVDEVQRLTHADVLGFRERQWATNGGVVVLAGNLDHLDRTDVDELLERIPARPRPPAPPVIPPFERRVEVTPHVGDVAHLRLAYAVPGLDRRRLADRAAADVCSQVIGGPAGSRLFEELRETRGLCYAVDGYISGYDDTSLLWVDCSLLAANVAEAYRVINAIVDDLRVDGPTEEEAARARAYTVGTCSLAYESIIARADYALEAIMEFAEQDIDPMLYLHAVQSVTRDDTTRIAARIAPRPCVGCLGAVEVDIFE